MILVADDFRDGARALAQAASVSLVILRGLPRTAAKRWPATHADAAEEPLLVVLDEMMPEMSGIETLQAIRAIAGIRRRRRRLFHSRV